MLTQWKKNWCIFKHMIHCDFLVLKTQVIDIIINTTIWCSIVTICSAYIMPSFGVSQEFAMVMVGGIIASAISFAIYPHAVTLATDLHNNKKIGFLITVPVPWFVIMIKTICSFLMAQLIISSCAIPIIKVLVFNKLNLSLISWPLFVCMFLLCNIFCACFTLFVATFIPDRPLGATIVWMRFVFPLWFFGCFQFTWFGLHNLWPIVAVINLLNPFVYIMEGMRGALLPGEQSLPPAFCALMLVIFSCLSLFFGSRRLKKKLDAV